VVNKKATVCVAENGQLVGDAPSLEKGQQVSVQLLTRKGTAPLYALTVKFQRITVKGEGATGTLKRTTAQFWTAARAWNLSLTGAGTLSIDVTRTAGTETLDDLIAKPGDNAKQCTVPAGQFNQTIDVAGRYYFSAGIGAIYAPILSRSYGLQTGDDGVQRITKTDTGGVDIVANVTAYPWGVDERVDRVALGFMLGTSMGSFGKRWYLGPQLTAPIGIGVTGGIGIQAAPVLEGELVNGQPATGQNIPTETGAIATWFVGINLEAQLFKTVFGALFEKDTSVTTE